MGNPVVHFEVDGEGRREAARRLLRSAVRVGVRHVRTRWATASWRARATSATGAVIGSIGGGVATRSPEGYAGHVTFYVGVPDVEARRCEQGGEPRRHARLRPRGDHGTDDPRPVQGSRRPSDRPRQRHDVSRHHDVMRHKEPARPQTGQVPQSFRVWLARRPLRERHLDHDAGRHRERVGGLAQESLVVRKRDRAVSARHLAQLEQLLPRPRRSSCRRP